MKRPPMINAELLERIVNSSEDGITVAEQEGDDTILIYVNQGFERLTGYSADEILYRDCRFLQNDDRDQTALANVRRAIAEGRPCREVIRNYRKDGSLFWNELSITPVFNEQDRLTYYIGVQKDVTAYMQALQELETLRSRPEGVEE
ncbi:PAS domain-containing protein [Halomonas sp. McH1-25]|uniref:PAS domain-containing protein n=1 Tax=unclassified Halomonas TaxID=2609666 RepID=UPI001EF4391D|nr:MULTISPECIES: PAS domain-containing protein [unclassified Halomonas]MCG7600491.1 PAS domain-containing protein [Halomonas sp. McH1-25]MCP1343551.1 PAS domain-containing protein [Halomonas sp. FL8]MCP1359998.1 PAS domain-containing protein [Halomonas sp. BBD45]MCP1365089.1 PAS domain-containing protein [Halomonas sp. BBD48]